jgi:alkanesulfonate monooxygenase SsuD/methylene tetrahydromethanopterin reductase-like flavin-dependent oxidoreductase (luciferase family)
MFVSCSGTYSTTPRLTQASSESGPGRLRIEVGETDVSDTGSMRLRLGVFGNSPAEAVILAQHAEALGFDQTALGEASRPSPVASGRVPAYGGRLSRPRTIDCYDPLVFASAICVATARLRVTTGVVIMTLQYPLLAARALGTAASIGSRRFTLGVGAA